MKKDISINDTLNELLLKVLSGVDYVSRIALETQKSIPVVYRQLDSLVDLGILSKQRNGKKVAYCVDWVNLSDIITSTLFLDIEKLHDLTIGKSSTINEIESLIKDIPMDIINDQKAFGKMVLGFFNTDRIRKLFSAFVSDLGNAGNDLSEYSRLDFKQSIDMFFDMIGMMSQKEQQQVLKDDYFKNKEFLELCRFRYLQKQAVDPRKSFLKDHLS